jgi:hypothetical protein
LVLTGRQEFISPTLWMKKLGSETPQTQGLVIEVHIEVSTAQLWWEAQGWMGWRGDADQP